MFSKSVICVRYELVEGHHVFYSEDLPGLYVVHRDFKTAFNDVAVSIKVLLWLDHQVDAVVSPEMNLEEHQVLSGSFIHWHLS